MRNRVIKSLEIESLEIESLFDGIFDEPVEIDENEIKRYLYDEMVRINLLLDETLSGRQISGRMSALLKKARLAVTETGDEARLEQLLAFFYQQQGFQSDFQHYFDTEHLLVNQVLQHRVGTPVSIGAILLYLAWKLAIPLFPVNFPTQLVLRANLVAENGRHFVRYLDPWNGKWLSVRDLEKWLEAEAGLDVSVTPDLLKVAQEDELLERVEVLFKMALTGSQRYEEALRLIEHRLIFSPEDPYEIRDRGMVLASLDCYQAACDDFSYFIDQCPNDPSTEFLKKELKGLERKGRAVKIH